MLNIHTYRLNNHSKLFSLHVLMSSEQGWKTDRFLVPFRPGALFSVASYPLPGLSP